MMTIKEFWEHVDSIDIESREDGRFTEDEMFEIGVMFKTQLDNGQKREIGGWDYLTSVLKPLDKDGNVMTKGDTFRQWIKDRCYRTGTMEPNVHLLSGKTIETMSFGDFTEKTEEIKQDLFKQQVKTRDTLNSYRRVLREEARLEDFKSLMRECVVDLAKLPVVECKASETSEREGVLMLSDLHLGINFKNSYNCFNADIARKRMAKLTDDAIKYCVANKISRLYVLLLGDFVNGTIHTNARLEQQLNIVEQIMLASEILADVLNKLQEAAPEIIVGSCTDNHSRALPDLHESIEAENYGKLITFYLQARLEGTKIKFKTDNLDQEIGLIEFANGKVGVFMHGHHDGINTLFQSMVAYTGKVISYGFIGHYHQEKMKSFNGFRVFVNGSVVGLEQYSFSRRLFGKPSQTLLIFDGNNIINHSIDLDIQ